MPDKGQSTHIVGGDVVYSCTVIDTVRNTFTIVVTFTMYRDAINGQFGYDPGALFGVYRGRAGRWSFVKEIVSSPFDISVVDNPDLGPCLTPPRGIRIEKGLYQFPLTLPIIDQSYMISYQRCCRNETINNILNPGDTGAAFTVEITPQAQRSCNSSPKFRQFPPTIICLGERLQFDHSAFDRDGDQLVYEFCSPLSAGGTGNVIDPCESPIPDPQVCRPPFDLVAFNQPTYNALKPMGGQPVVEIDSESGLITGVPNVQGQFVVGVCVKEYRNGELIGVLNRDFQFNVVQCQREVTADIKGDELIGYKEYLIKQCGPSEIQFENLSYDEANIISYKWDFGEIGVKTSRDASFNFPEPNIYRGEMIVNEGYDCADTARVVVDIKPAVEGDFFMDYDTCDFGPVSFDYISTGEIPIERIDWGFGDGGVSTLDSPIYQYKDPGRKQVSLLLVDQNNCRLTIEKDVIWQPVPELIIIEPSTFIGCAPGEVTFNNLSSPIDSTYTVNWTFGDGKSGNGISPSHIYEESGRYDVFLEIISPAGCYNSRLYPNWIEIQESPEAGFAFSPEELSILNKAVDFTDLSNGAIGWFWEFDSLGISNDRNTSFEFPDTGKYVVTQTVINENACTDIESKIIDVKPLVTLHMPNAFTPNNDLKNDVFYGVGFLESLKDYKLSIFNRWGEMIFTSDTPEEGWNGRKYNSGEESPAGVYVYVVNYTGPRGNQYEKKGHLTLIR